MSAVAEIVGQGTSHKALPVDYSAGEIGMSVNSAIDHRHTNTGAVPSGAPGNGGIGRLGVEVGSSDDMPVRRDVGDVGQVGQREQVARGKRGNHRIDQSENAVQHTAN